MRIVFLLTLSIFFSLASFAQEPDVNIPWDPTHRLTWYDFQGQKVDSINGLAASMADVDVKCIIIEDSLTFRVYNNFISNLSFVDSIAFQTYNDSLPDLLEHEQIHFDIAEIHARLMRKRLLNIANSDSADVNLYSEVIKSVYDELDRMNDEFDRNTAHGIMEFRQKIWVLKVDSILTELSTYYETNEKPLDNDKKE
jgi:hypothetical protein